MVLDHLADRLQHARRWLTATTVAMEASDRGVVVLRMVPSGKGQAPRITDCAVAALPEGFITAGVPQEPEALGHFIRDLLEEGDIPVRDVALDLSPTCCQARLLRLPETIPTAALPQLVHQLGTDAGFPEVLQEAQIATLPLAPQAAAGLQPVLLIGCEHSTVAAWIRTMAAAGLTLRRLGWAQTTLLQALQELQPLFGALELVGLLDLQPGTGWLTLVLDGVPYAMTSLPGLPDSDFHQRLQQHLEGEEPGPDGDLLPLNLQASQALVWALINAVETAQRRHGHAHMAQLYLAGPGSTYPRIAQQIAEQSGWPTALLDPMTLLNVHHPLPPEAVAGSAMARLVTTAMEDIQAMAKASATRWPAVDLLVEQRRASGLNPPQRLAASLVLWRGAAAGLALLAGVAALGVAATRERLAWTRRVAALAPAARKYEQLQGQLQQSHHHLTRLRQSNGALVQALTSQRPHSLLLMELAAQTPPGVQLLELNGAPDGITLKGQAENWPLVNLLQLQLQASPLFQQGGGVQVKGFRPTAATETPDPPNRVNFQLTARFQPQPLHQPGPRLQQRGGHGLPQRLQLLEAHGLLSPVQSHATNDQLQ